MKKNPITSGQKMFKQLAFKTIGLGFVLLALNTIACTPMDSQSKKAKFLDSHKHSHSKKTGKVRSSLVIEIKDVSQNDQTLDLQASLHPNMRMEGATIEWQIPEGSSIVAGRSTNQIDLEPGENKQLQISLDREKIKNNDQFFVFVYIMRDGEKLGGTSSFIFQENSQEESSEEVNQKLKKNPRIVE